MQSAEPMTMGSPAASPSAHNQYLPSYLLGHPSPVTASPTNRLWSSVSNSPSKPATNAANKSGAWPTPTPTVFSPPNRDLLPSRGKDKTGAPPVQGLLDHITTPINTPDRKLDLLNMSSRTNQSFHQTINSPSPYYSPNINPLNSSESQHLGSLFDTSKKTSPSPPQIDPFYTQGESIGPTDELDETWVTIFGFPAAAASFILQQFSQYGNILKHVISIEGNWLHIHYQSKLQAKKALSKNGKIFGGSIMVGVTRCIDKSVMDKENSCPSFLGSPDLNSTVDVSTAGPGGTTKHVPIRPLTAAYRAASSDQEVVMKNNTPQKSGNIVSKAVEYMFGW